MKLLLQMLQSLKLKSSKGSLSSAKVWYQDRYLSSAWDWESTLYILPKSTVIQWNGQKSVFTLIHLQDQLICERALDFPYITITLWKPHSNWPHLGLHHMHTCLSGRVDIQLITCSLKFIWKIPRHFPSLN